MDKRDSIIFKPLLFPVPPEREAIYNKLKHYMSECDKIINDPNVDQKLKMKAIDSARGLANLIFPVLKNIEEEYMHKEIAELKAVVKEALRKRESRKQF